MSLQQPGEGLKTQKMPGHWVLARLGKRVLRPGGMELTRRMLKRLDIKPADEVVEFAPGMGTTARLTLALSPSSYTAVERDEAAAKIVRSYLEGDKQRCVTGSASDTHLPSDSATVVYGEAMLTMQTEEVKAPDELLQYQEGAIVSRLLLKNKGGTVTLFAFDRGEDLKASTRLLSTRWSS